jgi:hypothetical protein
MRERILFIAAVVALLALVPAVYYYLFERSLSVIGPGEGPPPPPPSVAPGPADPDDSRAVPVALSVMELEGQVEITQAGGASWRPAEEGQVVTDRERIRTGQGSSALLSMPGAFSVRLDAESEFQIRSLAENAARFLLEQGMLSAEVREDPGRLFEVAAASSVVRTRGADFRMNVSQAGLVAVGTTAGQVELESRGKVVQVQAGYLARAERDQPPQDPMRIPPALFLKVRWPARSHLARRDVEISGSTEPGARVRVEGMTVQVDARGQFRQVVGLQEGENRLLVESVDVGGNQAQARSPPLRVDTRPDRFEIRTSPEMWKKRKEKDGRAGD